MSGAFVIALIKKDNSIADIAWGMGFILVAGLGLFLEKKFTARSALVDLLTLVWGLRLSVYVFFRNRKKGEDFRYAKWRQEWGKWFIVRAYLQVFLLQGVLLVPIAYPLILVNYSKRTGLNILDFVGTCVWLLGFCFESIGDHQLLVFKRESVNKSKIMNRGLWRYTRHPNYFGEATIWWGIFLIALSAQNGWTALPSPILMTFLLLRVSGVVMLEKKYRGNQEYAEYARKTSSFIPWRPKN